MNDRIKRLHSRIVTVGNEMGAEKMKINFRTRAENPSDTPVMLRAKQIYNTAKDFPIFILDDELIVGNPASHPWGYEYECDFGLWSREEIEYMREDGFTVSKEVEEAVIDMQKTYKPVSQLDYMGHVIIGNERLENFLAAGMLLPPWKKADKSSKEQRVGGGTYGGGLGLGPGWMLAAVEYAQILNKGVNGLIAEVDEELSKIRYFERDDFERGCTLQAMRVALEALAVYGKRVSELASKMAAEETRPQRKKELEEIAAVCARVPAEPARTFREAIQCLWFQFLFLNPGSTTSLGRMDQYLYPFYKADIEAGRTTDEEVLELLECFRIRTQEVCFSAGRENRKRNSAGGRWYNATIGGVKPDGSDATNELTYLILDAVMDCPTPHHTVTLRIADSTPDAIMLKAVECLKLGRSMPAFVGDKSYMAYFMMPNRSDPGLPIEDARDYCMCGCIDGNVQGKTRSCAIAMFITTIMLDCFLNDGVDPKTGLRVDQPTGDLDAFKSFDEFYTSFKRAIKWYNSIGAEKGNIESSVVGALLPEPLYSALMTDGIKVGLDTRKRRFAYENGNLMNPVGMVNLAQCMYTIKRVVYDEKKITLSEFKKVLDANWEGYDDLRQYCLDLPHYGNNEPDVDYFVRDLYDYWADCSGLWPSSLGGYQRTSAISVTSHDPGGKLTGATPDGRHRGDCLADACASPMAGFDHEGPLSVFQSAMKIPADKYQAMLMNMKISPSALKTKEDMLKLTSAIRTYFANGGKQVQFNVVSAEELKAAQEKPEEHSELMVRVAGYSAYYTQLTKTLQDEVLARTAHEL